MLGRVLVFVLAVAVLVDVSQAILPALKRAHEKAFKRYIEEAKEKMADGAKRQWADFYSCPLYQCYFTGDSEDDDGSGWDFDWSSYSCSATGNCMGEKLQSGNICNCSVNDIIWAQREAKFAETCDQLDDYDDKCYECYAKLPDDIWNPEDMAFSCDKSRVDEAEACFAGLSDRQCVDDLMAGFQIEPKYFFEAARKEIDGCPLSYIVISCMDDAQGYYGDFTSCALSYGGLGKTKACVKDMILNIPTCDIPDDLLESLNQALDGLVIGLCQPVEEAVSLKGGCCEAQKKREAEEEARGTKYHKYHKQAKKTVVHKFHKFHKASVMKKILAEAGLL